MARKGFLAGDLVAQVEFAQRVFLDVAENAHGITDLAEFGNKERWPGETGA